MRIEITEDAVAYRAATESFLSRDLLRHTVIATGIANHVERRQAAGVRSRFLSVRAADGAVVGVAMRAGGREVYLGELPTPSLRPVAEAFAAAAPDNSGVEGIVADAEAFAEHWCALRGTERRELFRTRLFRLGELRFPAAVEGGPRRAMGRDVALCVEWSEAMHIESALPPPFPSPSVVRGRVAAGRWWLWEVGGRPVSLVAHQVPVGGLARIGPVYTPPAERGHGYASALTAHVSHTLRRNGLDVCLFADLANPTSNKIYRAIGYEAVHEFANYVFE
ncbi:FR47-like protein [Nocardia amikacinitolerans]|uniref:FR47-like protein n=1 Tax=Nocardia amikacinitolerans TaxID=756689 RepID=A0A285LBA1_9NOCA|nr:GNAT family N-acetyltransferase [Nocardia amikacinitolerans]MCP2274874.1 FR47-like protein [Nocardia amikacinitolerans]MCP2296383.1 FR47-like protein [Nocardia amikacinitolerans]SNY80661.1 FR47-like protein [Nocardia amikacinitolerans]